MKIAAIQMKVGYDKDANVETALKMIEAAAKCGADVAVLPEMFNCPYENEYFTKFAEEESGATLCAIADAASRFGIYIVAGSIPEKENSRIYNASFVFDRQGKRIARHRKVHLFDIDVAGGQRFFESDTFTAGDEATVFDTEFCKVGLCICFDMRFPELSRVMTDMGARVIIAPAAFNPTTGPAHWEVMLRSRAIDNQVFVVGAEPARNESANYIAYGNSMIVSPWGDVLSRAGVDECLCIADIDLSVVDRVRRELPLLISRRFDVYDKNCVC